MNLLKHLDRMYDKGWRTYALSIYLAGILQGNAYMITMYYIL